MTCNIGAETDTSSPCTTHLGSAVRCYRNGAEQNYEFCRDERERNSVICATCSLLNGVVHSEPTLSVDGPRVRKTR